MATTDQSIKDLRDLIGFYNRGSADSPLYPESLREGAVTLWFPHHETHKLVPQSKVDRSVARNFAGPLSYNENEGRLQPSEWPTDSLGNFASDVLHCLTILNPALEVLGRLLESSNDIPPLHLTEDNDYDPKGFIFPIYTIHKRIRPPYQVALHLGLPVSTGHLIAFSGSMEKKSLKIWVQKRPNNQLEWPGMYDTAFAATIWGKDLECAKSALELAAKRKGMSLDKPKLDQELKYTVGYDSFRESGDSKLAPAGVAPGRAKTYACDVTTDSWKSIAEGMEKRRNELFFEFSVDEVVKLLLDKKFRPCSAVAMIGFLEKLGYPMEPAGENECRDLWKHPGSSKAFFDDLIDQEYLRIR